MADLLIATSLRWLTRIYVEAVTTGQTMTVEPEAAATFALTLEAAVGRLEEIDQLTESDDRLRRELRIQEAEVARLRQRLFLLDPAERASRVGSPSPTPSPESVAAARACFEADARAAEARVASNVIDLSEELRRERRDCGRLGGPEGGVA